jgi:hypothetical protein
MENKLNQKDFKIGQVLTCVKLDHKSFKGDYYGGEPNNERLILGEKYTITDLEYRFPDRVCVKLKGPHYFHEEFVPIECFCDLVYMRDFKIDKILQK